MPELDPGIHLANRRIAGVKPGSDPKNGAAINPLRRS